MSLLPFPPAGGLRGPARVAPDAGDDRRRDGVPSLTPRRLPATPDSDRRAELSRAADRAAERAADRAKERAAARSAVARTDATATPEAEERDPSVRRREPADFAELMALLADTAVREVQTARARGLVGPSPAGTPGADEADRSAPEGAAAGGDAVEPGPLGGAAWRADALRDALRDTLWEMPTTPDRRDTQQDALRPPVSPGTGSPDLTRRLGAEDVRSLPEVLDPAVLAPIGRARRESAGELLARGDAVAASVRASLDSLLDTAGTPRGRALAEVVAPPGLAIAGAARTAANVTTPIRDPDALAPAFRARLERVIDRMRDEFGHDVQLVETARSAERQEHLFAQGRTRPGPVVTWTLDSAHRSGEAADVIVDGQWHHPQGYQRLHAIAAEEGLQTLGMRDPGHLELRGSATEADRSRVAQALAAAGTTGAMPSPALDAERRALGVGDAFGIARVASVARVATVASVARVATVARPGAGAVAPDAAPTSSPATPSLPNGLAGTASRLTAMSAGGEGRGARPDGEARSDRDASGERRGSAEGLAGSGLLSPTVARALEQAAARVVAPAGSDAAVRAEQIAVLRDDAPAPAVNALTLQLESPEGPEQVRVHLRGGVVGADVSTSSAALADRLRLQTADLQDALGRHGLESDGVRVQQAARAPEAEAARLAAVERGDVLKAAGATASQQGAPFEQGSRDRSSSRSAERDPRDAQDDSPNQRRRDGRQEQR